ncbi:malonyl-ACP O-methyltransferase BioC [Persicobacter diffluens]|uniref:Malonyl-[acyl-carrier protein] O-methyltransferase n=1 Tax=Persicobacter diffluens TaxID=981 RepID=A0AAN5AQP6_9BACT|nr:malonyl-[acyl-carrier protein] O-methyltransferase [Persicobacter diffluens]
MLINKELVQSRFRDSLQTYDEAAFVQAEMAEHLSGLIRQYIPENNPRCLEIGCGSGMLSRRMPHDQIDQYWGNDLVNESLPIIRQYRPDLHPLPGDIEQLLLPDELDLIVSGSTFQWVQQPEAFYQKLHRQMLPGRLLCFSTFGPENCREIRQLTGQGLHYQAIESYPKLMPDFELLHAEETTYTLYFENAREVLRHIKATGVNGLQASMKVADLMRFQREYQKQFQVPKGVSLTYHAIYIIAKAR